MKSAWRQLAVLSVTVMTWTASSMAGQIQEGQRNDNEEARLQRMLLTLMMHPMALGEQVKVTKARFHGYKPKVKGAPSPDLDIALQYEHHLVSTREKVHAEMDPAASKAKLEAVRQFKSVAAKVGIDELDLRERLYVPQYEKRFGDSGTAPHQFKWLGLEEKLGAKSSALTREIQEITGLDAHHGERLMALKLIHLWRSGVKLEEVKDLASLNASFRRAEASRKKHLATIYGFASVEEYERARAAILQVLGD